MSVHNALKSPTKQFRPVAVGPGAISSRTICFPFIDSPFLVQALPNGCSAGRMKSKGRTLGSSSPLFWVTRLSR